MSADHPTFDVLTFEVDLSTARIEADGFVDSCPLRNGEWNTCAALLSEPDHCTGWDDEREVAVLNPRCPIRCGAVVVRRK